VKGDRVEAVVDTGQGVQAYEIVATRVDVTTGRRIGTGGGAKDAPR
jgi:hypothetical protein